MSNHTTEPYVRLARHLDETPLGAPMGPELMSLLAELFEPDEAALVAALPLKPARTSSLAGTLGRQADELGRALASLADRGLVYQRRRADGDHAYSMLPLVPGVAELQFMGPVTGDRKLRLARLFEAYYRPGLGKSLVRASVPYPRVIPVGRAVPVNQEILPYEQASHLIREARVTAITDCYCRTEAKLLGGGCDAPTDVCMIFGPFAEFAVAKGWARAADETMMLGALDRAEAAGLVHVCDNVTENVSFLCNCCGDCCMFLRTITDLERPGAVAAAAFAAQPLTDACTACGSCLEACQVGALSLPEGADAPLVDESRCLGCGLCTTACPDEAMTMARRARPQPPGSLPELVSRLKAPPTPSPGGA